ncbi:glycosyltransferase family 2 protein [Methylophilus sp. 14]|uniref:glycosyltransferase family 2 protein n=1 Tax=Methylophilus sp. 14 TaxID=2781019 RepID=UPI00188FAA01|nr:glycosyltransferase family 2 protein [Methylophilus sp. 14]MBF4988685.1 glycosyltransferase family 2 protein [Methylophilus sp. 14]
MDKVKIDSQLRADVSVVIPCYRCADSIGRAFESIQKQTVLPTEVILVDDASDDLTKIKLQEIIDANPGFAKLIALDKNKGAANARNVGWNSASQPYIALLDSDDAWHPQKIEIQYNFMKENPDVSLCGHELRIVNANASFNWSLGKQTYSLISKLSILIRNPFCTPSVMFNKNIGFRFNEKKRHVDDHLLWMQIALSNYKVIRINIPLVAIFKPMYGATGLSAQMWAMEKSELNNYWLLFKENKINFLGCVTLFVFSYLKFIRRLMLVFLRKKLFAK